MEGAVGFRGQTYSPQTPARSPGEVLGDPSLQFPVSPPTSTLLDPKERFPGTRSALSDPGQDRQKQSRRARSPGRGLACVVISRLRGRGGPSDYNLILLPLPTPQVELRRRSSRWRGWRKTTPPKRHCFQGNRRRGWRQADFRDYWQPGAPGQGAVGLGARRGGAFLTFF